MPSDNSLSEEDQAHLKALLTTIRQPKVRTIERWGIADTLVRWMWAIGIICIGVAGWAISIEILKHDYRAFEKKWDDTYQKEVDQLWYDKQNADKIKH